jgi:hypothetical protein
LEDGYKVFGESLGFLGRALCPGAVGCADRRRRFSGVFEVFCGFPEGIVGGCGGGKDLEEGLDAMIAILLEK